MHSPPIQLPTAVAPQVDARWGGRGRLCTDLAAAADDDDDDDDDDGRCWCDCPGSIHKLRYRDLARRGSSL
jgi:hypothetical protein